MPVFSSQAHSRGKNFLTFFLDSYGREDLSAMPWYQALPILGSAAALSIIIFTRPNSDSRPMAFTLLVGALVLTSVGFAAKHFVTAIYTAAWLGSG
jgi:cytochrome bd-type quinol oxidase subunit 2